MNIPARFLWSFLPLLICLPCVADAAAEKPAPLSADVTNSIYYQRWLWTREAWVSEDGHVPSGARTRALDQTRQAMSVLTSTPGFSPAAAVPGNAWLPIGPAPIFNGQTSGSQPVSGRIGDIAVNPSNYNHWVIGTAQGGLWLTRDAGSTWRAISDDQASLAFGAVAFAPSATNVIYAGTGEEVFSSDAVAGAGVLKSSDGGVSWQLLAAGTFAGYSFSVIRVHPADPNVVLASTTRGIYKSTDGGVNWTQKRSGTGTDLEVDSSNFTNQYCAIGSTGGSALNGVYRSTTLGETWALITGPWTSLSGVGRIEMAISPSSPSTLYVSVHNSSTGGSLGMWRTDNAWDATPVFVQLPDPGSGFGNLWYNHEIIVDPANPNLLYAGATTFKKFDGVTWTEILQTMHVDFHAVAFAGTRLVIGNDGGMWSTINGGSSYVNHNTNLQLTQFYHGSISTSNPNFALGGSQDNGTARWDGTNGWRLIFGGDGADNAIARINPSNYWAISYQNLEIRRTRNGGASFEDALSGIGTTGRPFIGRFDKSPQNDDIFITGTTTIWKTTNFFSGATATWTANSPDFGVSYRSGAFARSDLAANTYAVGFSGGAMRITTDGGANWRDLDPANLVPSRSVYDLAFNPTNANLLYVALLGTSGGTPSSLWRTTNALNVSPAWENVSFPADVPARSIAMDQDDPAILYVGTQIGVWKTSNGGASWVHMGPEVGMPNVEVDELRLDNTTSRLVAFTHGRGAFALVTANSLNLTLSQSPSIEPASVGCELTFTLNVVNLGPQDATQVTVTNRLPVGVTFSAATASQGSFMLVGSAVVFNVGNLALGNQATLSVTVLANAAGSLTNSANVSSAQTDTDPSNNLSTRVVAAQVDTGAPRLLSAAAQSNAVTITLTFSEPVMAPGALNPANYSLRDSRGTNIPITAAAFGPTPFVVLLDAAIVNGLGPIVLTAGGLADCVGNFMTATQINLTVPPLILLPLGATWRYLDNGVDQGTAWRNRVFDDSAWGLGGAQLGYGDGDEITVLNFGPDANAKYPTYYFRRAFYIQDASAWSGLNIRLLRDDGAVVYLNGVEVFRSNMPAGTILNSTFASAAVSGSDEATFYLSNIGSGSLTNGTNVIAVEIHQSSATSSDVSFDLELAGILRSLPLPTFGLQPFTQIAECGGIVTFRAYATNGLVTYQWYGRGLPLAGQTNTNIVVVASAATSGLYYEVAANSVGSVTSSIVALFSRDNLPPVIMSCAPNTTIAANSPTSGIVPDLTSQLVAVDACSGTLTILQSPPAGTQVGLGATNINFSVTDISNRTAMCSATLTVVTVTPPGFSMQPKSVSASAGDTVQFTCNLTNAEPVTFRWRFNGADIPGAISQTLILSNVQYAQAGSYSVMASNIAGTATSDGAALWFLAGIDYQAGFPFYGPVGAMFQVQYTANLANGTNAPWMTLTNFTLPSNPYYFIDPTPVRPPIRFYRAILLP